MRHSPMTNGSTIHSGVENRVQIALLVQDATDASR
jgi:hypothetical protein